MARGNERDKARQKNLEKLAKMKGGNKQSGTQFAAAKESTAEIMRQKQAAAEARKTEGGEAAGTKK